MRLLGLILLVAVAAHAQVADGITASSQRTVSIAPDQAEFSVVIGATPDTTQQQVTQLLQDAGIQNLTVTGVSANNFTLASFSTSNPPTLHSTLYFQISFVTAPSAMGTFASRLSAIHNSLPANFISLYFAAALNASSAAVEAARSKALPLLLSDARAKAQQLATAANLGVGAIRGVSDLSSFPFLVPANRISPGGPTPFVSANLQSTFFVAVKFATQ